MAKPKRRLYRFACLTPAATTAASDAPESLISTWRRIINEDLNRATTTFIPERKEAAVLDAFIKRRYSRYMKNGRCVEQLLPSSVRGSFRLRMIFARGIRLGNFNAYPVMNRPPISGPGFSHIPSVPRPASQGVQSLQTSSPPLTSQETSLAQALSRGAVEKILLAQELTRRTYMDHLSIDENPIEMAKHAATMISRGMASPVPVRTVSPLAQALIRGSLGKILLAQELTRGTPTGLLPVNQTPTEMVMRMLTRSGTLPGWVGGLNNSENNGVLDAKNLRVELVLLGDSGVGKSCIVLRFVRGQFDPTSKVTIGVPFLSQTIALQDSTTVKFEILDIAGEERNCRGAALFCRGAAVAVIAYDITSPETFNKAQFWVKNLQKHGSPDIVMALVGNKADLHESRQVPTQDAVEYAERNRMFFIETSAKTADNINQLFEEIAKRLPRPTST